MWGGSKMQDVLQMLEADIGSLDLTRPYRVSGRVSRFDGHIIECDGFPATIGTLCEVATEGGNRVNAEVIGFQNNHNLLSVHDHDRQASLVGWSRW